MMLLDYIRSLPIYDELTQVHNTNEGNLLGITDRSTVEAQISFFIWAFSQAAPMHVLEIGTNKGYFGLLLSILAPYSFLETIDINPDSAKAAAILREKATLEGVYFTCGSSMDVLPAITTPVVPEYDFAWVDGHHGYEFALSDLTQCARLGIPYIAIDDTNMNSVMQAVTTFLDTMPYTEVPNPFITRDARKARLLKLNNLT